jgi:hypothetical protein
MNLGIRRLREEGKRGTLFVLRATRSEPTPSTINQRNLTQSFLCDTCRAVDIHGLFTWNREEPQWDLQTVLAQSRCDFCRLLQQLAVDDHGLLEVRRLAETGVTVRLERCSLWEYKYRGGVVGRRITILSPAITASVGSLVHLSRAGRTESSFFRRHEDPEGSTCILPLGQGTPTFGLSPRTVAINVDLVKNWLRTCNHSHGKECWQKPTIFDAPKYLIDLKRNCITKNPGKSDLRYLALSYVWGSVKQPTLTKKALESWQKKGALLKLKLPQTIRDALVLTIDIGERYLWVDSLCIVQDDSEELLSQIGQMHVVYRQAYVTIIAASGSDSDSGLCGVRNSPAARTPQEVTSIGSMQLSTLHIKPHGELRKSVWNSRGWTFQEEICSSRRLVFTDSMVTFNCMAATWREDFPERLMMNNRERYSYLYTSFISGQSIREDEKEDIMKWYSVIMQNYLSRDLTDPGDILKAFAGVTSLVADVLGDSMCGLPGNYLHEALCWKTDENAGVPIRRRDGFPSWSWAGWYHSQYRADRPVFHLLPRENSISLKEIVWFVSQAMPDKLWPKCLKPIHEHFTTGPNDITELHKRLDGQQSAKEYHIGFITSETTLRVERCPYDLPASEYSTYEYCLRCPESGLLIGTMLANMKFRAESHVLYEFIVIGLLPCRTALFEDLSMGVGDMHGSMTEEDNSVLADELEMLRQDSRIEDSFILLMIERSDGVASRMAITKPVPLSRWWRTNPRRSMVILG